MAFKNKSRFPESVKDLQFEWLQGFQIKAMADYMGVLRVVSRVQGVPARRAALKEACEANWPKAQEAYDIIVLQKRVAAPGAVGPDAEKRAFEIVTEVVASYKDELRDKLETSLQAFVGKYDQAIIQLAKDAVRDAANNARPLIIKQEGKKPRKVKGVLPPEFERMVELASARIPILLVGPAGCGKTYLCEKLGEALGFEVSDQSCSEGMSESVFNGLLLPIGKGGEFKHVPSPFMQRYETGGVMLLDEVDAGDANLFTYINKAIANSSYTVPQRWTAPVVKKHEDFVLVAAANTFGSGADAMYVGRNQLDAATLDRFKVGMIAMDYSRDVELSLAPQSLCEWAWRVREAIRRNKLRRVMSTRVIENLGRMTRMYSWGEEQWNTAYFAGWSEADRNMVLQ